MQGQGQIIQQKYSVKTHVLVVDYNKMAEFEDYYQEMSDALTSYEICILVNN